MPLPQSAVSSDEVPWQIAIRQCEQDLPKEALAEIRSGTRPEDVLEYIKERQSKESKSRLLNKLSDVSKICFRFAEFQSALDVLAQGTPSPGCMVWGAIRVVLTVSNTTTDGMLSTVVIHILHQ